MNNFTKRLLFAGLGILALCNAGAEMIPGRKITMSKGSSRVSDTEYLVKIPQQNNISNSTRGLVYRPSALPLAGKTVTFSADMRCDGIASDTQSDVVGGKILVSWQDGNDERFYYAASSHLNGTVSDWKKYSVTVDFPAKARNITVTFGIQQAWGTLEIRNLDWEASAAPAGAAKVIPGRKFAMSKGCSRISDTEYLVKIPQQNNISNSTRGLIYRPSAFQLAGKNITFSADMRCEGIDSDTDAEHVGGKILVSYQDGTGERLYYAASSHLTGTVSDWKKYSVSVDFPAKARNITVTFGIHQGWGTLEVRNPAWEVAPDSL